MLFRSLRLKAGSQADASQPRDGFLPVLSAADITRAYELSQPISTIRNLVAVTDKHFELYYLAPINEFLMISQFLGKECVRERFSAIIKGLKLRRPLLLPTGVESESVRKSKDLWTYVTFAALLLYKVGPSVLGKVIVIKDAPNDRGPARRWHPLLERAVPHQVYRVIGEQEVTPYSSAYFLHRVLHENCLHWIMQDAKAFNTVVELIVAPNPESLLGALLLKAFDIDSSATQEPEPITRPAYTESEKQDEHSEKRSLRPGEAFYEWLKDQIKSPSEPSLESCCFNSSHGLALVCPDIFKRYATDHGGAWKATQNDFLKLKRHAPNPKNNGDFHTLTIPGRGNVNTLIVPGLTIDTQKP